MKEIEAQGSWIPASEGAGSWVLFLNPGVFVTEYLQINIFFGVISQSVMAVKNEYFNKN